MLLARICAAALALAAGASQPPALRELIWTDPSADRAAVLTSAPGECLAPAADAGARRAIETGRALFRSRTLLGGPAARVGLACDSCHANGRANAHFLLPELTDRAGAADVTSEWASKVRGDGVMNPRAIPDLVGVANRTRFGSDGETSLARFVDSVIVEEFQGAAPARARADILAYLAALDPAFCSTGNTAVTIDALADDVRRALAAAEANARANETVTADLTLLAAQDALARLAERLPERRFARERARIEALSRELGAARRVEGALTAMLPGWLARFDALVARIAPRAGRTYVNTRTLRAALETR